MGTGGIGRTSVKFDRTNLALYWQFDSTSEKVISSPAVSAVHQLICSSKTMDYSILQLLRSTAIDRLSNTCRKYHSGKKTVLIEA